MIEMLYDDEIRIAEAARVHATMSLHKETFQVKSLEHCEMRPVRLCKTNAVVLMYTVSSRHNGKPQIALPSHNIRIRLNESTTGELVLLRLQMCTRLFVWLPECELVVAESKPSFFDSRPEHLSKSLTVKFRLNNVVQFAKRLIIRGTSYAVLSVYWHSKLQNIYEVYRPETAQKKYAHSSTVFEQFELSGDCLNGLALVGVEAASDVRHFYCSAQIYADSVSHSY